MGKEVALKNSILCCSQRQRLKSCQGETAMTFQTLPQKNQMTARQGAEDMGQGGKGNERRATTRKTLCSWK